MNVLIAGGGTGGHVYPGLALADALARVSASALTLHWVGTAERLEARAVPRAGLAFHTIDVTYLKGRRGGALAKAAARLPIAGGQTLALLARLRPKAVIGVGGFASGPVGAAAAATGIPLFLLEQNAHAGTTNRLLSRVARVSYASFEASTQQLRGEVVVAGNPVRRDLIDAAANASERAPGPMRLLVVGGSQGAATLNEHTARVCVALRDAGVALAVRHASGRGAEASTRDAYRRVGFDAQVDGFIDDMAAAYAEADLVVCRAGATTIAELTALGIPALYVPFPHAADDHQSANARAVVEAGGGVMVRDDEFARGDRASRILVPLLRHPEVLSRMGAAAARLGRPGAAEHIARDLLARIGVETHTNEAAA